MKPSIVSLAILAYPKRWRRRYGYELQQVTIAVLSRPQSQLTRVRIVGGLVVHGLDERGRRTESIGPRTALTSASATVAGMFALATAVASDSVLIPNAQLSPSVHLGVGVAVHNGSALTNPGEINVVVPNRANPQVSVGAHAAVVIDSKSGRVVSITRARSSH